MDRPFCPQLRRAAGLVARAVFLVAGVASATDVMAACDAEPFDGVKRSIVGEQMWVNGVALSIVDLPSLDPGAARDRFVDYWRRANATSRTKSGEGFEVTSVLKGSCLYSLQLPSGGSGAAARYVVSDLRRPIPSLPREFDWPPAKEGEVLTDTISDDSGNLSRLLTYRVEKSSSLVAGQCIKRLNDADWKLEGLTQINEQHFVFHGRKRRTSVDVTIARDGLGSVVTINFAQSDG